MSTGVMSEKRILLANLADARDSARGGPKRRALIRAVVALVLVAIVVGLILWFLGFFSTPKEVLEIRSLVDEQIGQLQKVARNEAPLTYDTTNFRQNWDRMRDMPPEVRDQVRNEMERLFRAREKAERQSYFAMPPQERQKELDRRIQAEQSRRQARQQRGNQNVGNSPNGGQGQGGPGGRGGNARGGQGRGDAGGGTTQAGTAAPRRGGRGGSEDARNARSKQRIDSSSPEDRAQSVEYRRAMDARRQQLGLSPGRGRGG
jgi:hypothetical protein